MKFRKNINQVQLLIFHLIFNICTFYISPKHGKHIELRAYFSQHGLHGHITFLQTPFDSIQVNTNFQTTLQFPEQIWSWYIMEFPVDYTDVTENRCSDNNLGSIISTLDNNFGYLTLPDNATIEFETRDYDIIGKNGIYGRTLLLKDLDSNKRACATILVTDKSIERVAEAKFYSPISGYIYFRWIATPNSQRTDTLITTNLYRVVYPKSNQNSSLLEPRKNYRNKLDDYTEHSWKMFTTDILDDSNKYHNRLGNCDVLQILFNPNNKPIGQTVGDLDQRLGNLKIPSNSKSQSYKTLFSDNELFLLPSDIIGSRHLYIVIFDNKDKDKYLTCARVKLHSPIYAKSIIQQNGITGDITYIQNSRFDPTWININLYPANGDLESKVLYGSKIAGYKIHQLPIYPSTALKQSTNQCLTTNNLFKPNNFDENNIPPPGFGTQDQYPLGDLSGKHLNRNNATDIIPGTLELKDSYWDIFLPLRGVNSIVYRSTVLLKYIKDSKDTEPWICGNIALYQSNLIYQVDMFSARVLFRYPIVGSILFRQPKSDSDADTTILVEKLVHADGKQINNTAEHRWAIHEKPPGKDFYNWTARCISAGNVSNPFNVNFNENNPFDLCNLEKVGACRLSDLSTRFGTLNIAGGNLDSQKVSRKLFTDTLIQLTGPQKILGKSLVIYDDYGPKARGERFACSKIEGIYRRKAVVKDWFPNGDPLSVKGKIEFLQQTEYDITNVEVDLSGLQMNSGYHIHMTPVETDLEFPCEESTLYGHWNPLEIDARKSPKTIQGTTDQYAMGDLSNKFGTLDTFKSFQKSYNDTLLPLFGPRSIIGRSERDRRWVCSSIERGYSPSEAREIRAIASFHHPAGFAYGYVRMTQLIHFDNSKSDTIIEIKLRHPGKNDRNITRDHNWAIYVNPVGVDAAVKTTATRCVAGGYVWNPFYTQLADPNNEELYRQECNPDNPLRCYVGDVSGRLGTIDLGGQRKVFTDSNFPLEGDQSAVGKSIVILSPNQGGERFACANIEPDYDIIKYANIEKPPRFVLAQFIDDIREVLGIPEWMLTVDSRKTKILHNGGCIQLLMHFKGPLARNLEIDFNKLFSVGSGGKLVQPTLYVPGYVNSKRKQVIHYRQCGIIDPNEKNAVRKLLKPNSTLTIHQHSNFVLLFLIFVNILIKNI